ncbi:hypothetical protein R1flu_002224 [Riccia fluitans]|uniref:Uncharacterized protein n=1 Tax=Riccia fluitans TaxID=41844 RepID=A0ABD1Y5I2_9MARC
MSIGHGTLPATILRAERAGDREPGAGGRRRDRCPTVVSRRPAYGRSQGSERPAGISGRYPKTPSRAF